MKGMHCEIFKAKRFPDCSLGGISSQVSTVTLVGPGIPPLFEPSADAPAVVLRKVYAGGEYVYAVPLELLPDVDPKHDRGRPSMAGGCFIWTCDSRFPSRQPISLHDRVERGGVMGD